MRAIKVSLTIAGLGGLAWFSHWALASVGYKVTFNLWYGLGAGVFFGVFFLAIIFWLDQRARDRIRDEFGWVTPGLHQRRVFELPGRLAEVMVACEAALSAIGARMVASELTQGWFKAETPASWRTTGEVLTIEISSKAAGKVLVDLSSKPKAGALVDFGRNLVNAERLREELLSRMGQRRRVARVEPEEEPLREP